VRISTAAGQKRLLRPVSTPERRLSRKRESGRALIELLYVDGAPSGGIAVLRGAADIALRVVPDAAAALEAVPSVGEVRPTADPSAPVEVRGAPPSLASRMAELGATVWTTTADPDCTVVARVSDSVDGRSVIDGLRETFPEVTLLAPRERERSLRPPDTFRSRPDDRLTARQRAAPKAVSRVVTSSGRAASARRSPPRSTSPPRRSPSTSGPAR